MRLPLFAVILLKAAIAEPVEKLSDFELTDQDAKTRSYRFPKAKVTLMTVADHKGSDQLAPWIQALYDRYRKRIDIDGVADVSMIPELFHGMFREAFRKKLTYSVMLDWEGVSESLAAELKPLGIKVTIVQPGPFRTDFIGRSLDRAGSHIADYDRASGKFLRFLETMDGKQPGDPDKAAEAIIAAIESTRRRCGSSSANTQTTKCAENLRQPKQNSLPIGLSADYAYTP